MSRLARWMLLSAGLLLAAAKPPHDIDILRAEANAEYPLEITFSIEAESGEEIQLVELEYGLTGRDCTPDVNLAVPEDFSPAERIDLEWTWRVAASGNLPPGTKIWWSWHLKDAGGNDVRSEKEWITWIDSVHDWKVLASENVLLHWYRGSEKYNQEFLKAAEESREILRNDIGTWPSADINIYIYGSNQAMKDALVGEPDWIGGLSFGENQRTIIIGIDPGNEAWGKSTIAHELAHTAVDGFMGGCYASIPLWLNEGIAMVAEGELEEDYAQALEKAVYYDTLFSLRSISQEYQYIDGDPTLTYAEAHSVTLYVIHEYGREKIRLLLERLGEGYTHDNALRDAFGADMDELEDAWRASIGADPMPKRTAPAATAAALDTMLPPSSLPLVVSTLTPTPFSPPTPTPTGGLGAGEIEAMMQNPWGIAALCGVSLLCVAGAAAVVALFLLARRQPAAAGRNDG